MAVKFTFCSSTASVLGPNRQCSIEEKVSTTPSDAGSTGYSRSKWVAEALCAEIAKIMPGTISILRIGQLTGDTKNGVWNISEAWPLLLSTVDAINCLPELVEPLDWLPLDIAASAIIEITTSNDANHEVAPVYHLVNVSTKVTWSDLLVWSRGARSKPFEIVEPMLWLQKLESFPKTHPAKNLLGLWRKAYENGTDEDVGSDQISLFSTVQARKKSTAMQHVPIVDEKLVIKIWSWLEEEIKAAKEQVYVSRNRFYGV